MLLPPEKILFNDPVLYQRYRWNVSESFDLQDSLYTQIQEAGFNCQQLENSKNLIVTDKNLFNFCLSMPLIFRKSFIKNIFYLRTPNALDVGQNPGSDEIINLIKNNIKTGDSAFFISKLIQKLISTKYNIDTEFLLNKILCDLEQDFYLDLDTYDLAIILFSFYLRHRFLVFYTDKHSDLIDPFITWQNNRNMTITTFHKYRIFFYNKQINKKISLSIDRDMFIEMTRNYISDFDKEYLLKLLKL